MPSRRYDQLYARATEQRVSVPELIRRDLARDFRNPKSDQQHH